MEMSTNTKVLKKGRIATEKSPVIPHKDFKIAYMEHLMASQQMTKVKPPSKIDWWAILNQLLYPIGFILLSAEIFL